MGILDTLFGGQPTQPGAPGVGDRLLAGIQGFTSSPTPMAALGNLAGGLFSGARTDPAGVQQEAIRGQLGALISSGQITPTQARFLAANPKSWEELSKAMINQPVQVAPSGDLLVTRPFGQIGVPGSVPASEGMEITNPDGSKSPAFRVKPTLANPQGRIAIPGQQPAAPQAPQPNLLNPNLPNGGRSITEMSPQARKEQEGVGGNLADEYKTITTKASSATSRLGTLQRMKQLSPAAFEGSGAPALQFARSLLTSFGIPSNTVAAGTEFSALANKMVLDAQNGSLGAGVSNADVSFIQNINPNIAQDRQGREQLMDTLSKLAKRDQEVAREAQKYRQTNRGSMDGFQVYIQDWANRNPLFSGQPQTSNSFNDRFGAVNANNAPGAPGIRIIGVR